MNQTKGIIWSAIERFSSQGLQFILSIIIARLVSPADYGLIAMLTIFLAIAQSLVDCGFSNALIQKQDRNDTDYSTVFYFNSLISIFIYILFWLSSPFIALFYNEPELCTIARTAGINFIISALSIVQRTQMTISLNFKEQAKITLISVISGGIIGIILAWKNYGVWALVIQTLTTNLISTILFWIISKWRPLFVFSISSFNRLFSFGSKMLLTGLLATIYNNIYSLVIGKYFSSQDLGFYNRMNTLAAFPSSNITSIIARVVYPVQCEMQNDDEALKKSFIKLIKISSFIIFPLMLGVAALAQPLVYILLSEKWLQGAPLLIILCFALMWNHIMFLNWQILSVKGRSDLSFKSELIKKIISVIILITTIPLGIKGMCWGLIVYSICDIIIIIYFVRNILPIKYKDEFRALCPIFLLALSMYIIVTLITSIIPNYYLQFVIGIVIGVSFYIGCSYLLKFNELHLILMKISKHEK